MGHKISYKIWLLVVFSAESFIGFTNPITKMTDSLTYQNNRIKMLFTIGYSGIFYNNGSHPSKSPQELFDYMVSNSRDFGMPIASVGMVGKNRQTFSVNFYKSHKFSKLKKFFLGYGFGYARNTLLVGSTKEYLSQLEILRLNYSQNSSQALPSYLSDSIWTNAVFRKGIGNNYSVSFICNWQLKFEISINFGFSFAFIRTSYLTYQNIDRNYIENSPNFREVKSFWNSSFQNIITNPFINVSKTILTTERTSTSLFLGFESPYFNSLQIQIGLKFNFK